MIISIQKGPKTNPLITIEMKYENTIPSVAKEYLIKALELDGWYPEEINRIFYFPVDGKEEE